MFIIFYKIFSLEKRSEELVNNVQDLQFEINQLKEKIVNGKNQLEANKIQYEQMSEDVRIDLEKAKAIRVMIHQRHTVECPDLYNFV